MSTSFDLMDELSQTDPCFVLAVYRATYESKRGQLLVKSHRITFQDAQKPEQNLLDIRLERITSLLKLDRPASPKEGSKVDDAQVRGLQISIKGGKVRCCEWDASFNAPC